MAKISVVVSVYNEEHNIKNCLESAKSLADELIVIDNSSEDQTVEIAKKIADKVFIQKNDPKNIDLQKNFGFSKASSEWVFSLDADERVTPELTNEINSVISHKSSAIGFWMPRKNIIFGKWIQSDMWWPDYQLKLFKKGKGSFDKIQVHKALKVEGETQKLSSPLIHYNYSSVSQYVEKLNKYTNIEVESLTRQGYKFNWLDSLRFPVNDFVKTFFFQRGYKDGLHGLTLSILQAFYMEVVFAKLWEKEGFKQHEGGDFLKDLKKELEKSRGKLKFWLTSALINETKNPVKKILLRSVRKVVSLSLKDAS